MVPVGGQVLSYLALYCTCARVTVPFTRRVKKSFIHFLTAQSKFLFGLLINFSEVHRGHNRHSWLAILFYHLQHGWGKGCKHLSWECRQGEQRGRGP